MCEEYYDNLDEIILRNILDELQIDYLEQIKRVIKDTEQYKFLSNILKDYNLTLKDLDE